MGASSDAMVSKLDKQSFTSEFESHWVPHSYVFVPQKKRKKKG